MSFYPDSKYKNSLEVGLEYQDFVVIELAKRLNFIIQTLSSRKYQLEYGESLQGAEIKFDSWCSKTNRLSIEIAEKSKASNSKWVPSGIYRKDNTIWYIQGNYKIIFIFRVEFLRKLHQGFLKGHKGTGITGEKEETTIKTFYFPLDQAKKYAEVIVV